LSGDRKVELVELVCNRLWNWEGKDITVHVTSIS
jgi:hypothetical protein